MKDTGVSISLKHADAAATAGDIIVLKYAQEFHGVDGLFADHLGLKAGPRKGEHIITKCPPQLGTREAMFVGVPPLFSFRYAEIRDFAADALKVLARERPDVARLIMTLHGPGYGLDETEAVLAEIAGLQDAIEAGRAPRALREIWIVEIDEGRVQRLRRTTSLAIGQRAAESDDDVVLKIIAPAPGHDVGSQYTAAALTTAGGSSDAKSHVFVAMPFDRAMDDVYHYGIQRAVNDVGCLCERMDQEAFVGDVLQRILGRIQSATAVVADLTGANPNVYLELGYAWGCNRPTILLARSTEELRFDVRGHRCLKYDRIQDLEVLLTKELTALKQAGIFT